MLDVALRDRHVDLAGFSAIIDGDRARLVPTSLVTRSTAIERTCRERGVQLADEVTVAVEIADPLLAVSGLAEPPPPTPTWLAQPGRYRLEGVCWSSDDVSHEDRPSASATRLVSRIADRGKLPVPTIQAIAKLRAIPAQVIPTTLRGTALSDALVSV